MIFADETNFFILIDDFLALFDNIYHYISMTSLNTLLALKISP